MEEGQKKQIAYPSASLRIMAILIDLTILSMATRSINTSIFVFLFNNNLAQSLEENHTTINSYEDITRLLQKQSFIESLDMTQLVITYFESFMFQMCVCGMYFICMWTWQGYTVGKFLTGMKVVNEKTMGNPNMLSSAIRFACYAFFPISIVMMFFRKQGKGIHDVASKTLVVKV